ncbi:MAG: ATP-binding cassette domain-containing protein, partial [Desulfocapsaceae bacterium]|nr:ATP-binding cassette domain-containing protein [Desulfocapsaceae bacterium]
MMLDSAIVLDNVSKSYAVYTKQLVDRLKETFVLPRRQRHVLFEAVKPLNLDIKKGETVGILGHNGAGKSTLLKLIAGVKQPTGGSIEVNGQLVALLELGAGFNPEFTGLENIRFYCSLLGMTHEKTEAIIPAVLDFAE